MAWGKGTVKLNVKQEFLQIIFKSKNDIYGVYPTYLSSLASKPMSQNVFIAANLFKWQPRHYNFSS